MDEILPTDNSTLMETGSDKEILEAYNEWERQQRERDVLLAMDDSTSYVTF